MKRWQVLVPVKGTAQAKTRLGDAFGPHRPRLALAFARDTVTAAMNCSSVADVTVTTGDPSAAAAFAGIGAHVFEDAASDGLNAAISVAVRELPRLRDASGIAVLLGDLPALTPSALERALQLAASHHVAFVPDAKDSGTTLLCARNSQLVQPCFGVASAAAHEATGAVRLRDPRLTSLRHDVDDVADLLIALRLGVGRHTGELLQETERPAAEFVGASLILERIGGW